MTTEDAVTVSGFSLGCTQLDSDLFSSKEPFFDAQAGWYAGG